MKLYLGNFTLEGTPQEIKEVLDLIGIKPQEQPIIIPDVPYTPNNPQPWSPYNPNIWWWWNQPTCTAKSLTDVVKVDLNSFKGGK